MNLTAVFKKETFFENPRKLLPGVVGHIEMDSIIKIFENHFLLNDKQFNHPPRIADLKEILGSCRTRAPIVTAATSTIHTFDEHGIWVHVDQGVCSQISFLKGCPYIDFHPKTIFPGDIFIKDIKIINANDFLSINCEEIWDDEWEAEGSVTIELKGIHCALTGDYDSKTIEDICFWFA